MNERRKRYHEFEESLEIQVLQLGCGLLLLEFHLMMLDPTHLGAESLLILEQMIHRLVLQQH